MNLLDKIYSRAARPICALLVVLFGHQAHAYFLEVSPSNEHSRISTVEIDRNLQDSFVGSQGYNSVAASEESDLTSCYGDRLKVSVRSVIDENSNVLERNVPALPNPRIGSPSINTPAMSN